MKIFSAVKPALGAGIACLAFCCFFGGCARCAAFALAVGMLMYAIAPHICPVLRHFCVAVACGAAARITCCGGAFVLGTAMPFVTGLALCDGLCALLRAKRGAAKSVLRALARAFAMAAGYALAFPLQTAAAPSPDILWSAAGAFGFALMLGARPFSGALAALACGAACLYTNIFVAVFAAYAACDLLGRPSLARIAVVPLVPGGGLLIAFTALLKGSFALAAGMLLVSAHAFLSIAFARVCAHVLTAAVFRRAPRPQ